MTISTDEAEKAEATARSPETAAVLEGSQRNMTMPKKPTWVRIPKIPAWARITAGIVAAAVVLELLLFTVLAFGHQQEWLIPLTQVNLYVVGVAHEAGRHFCKDCLA